MDQSLLTTADLSVLHDAELCLVAMDRDAAKLRLGFRMVDHAVQMITFYDVLTYRIDNVQSQNVVSRIILSDADAPDDLEQMVRWSCSAGRDLLMPEQNFRRHLARVRSGELRLFYAEPSWGAASGVIARGFFRSGE